MSALLPETSLIAIPALNESATIVRVVTEAAAVAKNVCVIDDGSADATPKLAASAGAIVLRHESSRGLGGALMTAIEFARANNFQNLITVDGDGAHDPAFASQLVRTHQQARAGLTIGSRLIHPSPGMPSQKRAANLFASYLVNAVLNTCVTDVASGMRVIDARMFCLLEVEDSFAISFEFIRTAHAHRLSIAEYPITVRYDAADLLATTRSELLDLLRYCSCHCEPDTSLHLALAKLQDRAGQLQGFATRCGGVSIYAHPLPHHESFLFQEQNAWFARSNHPDEMIELPPARSAP